MLFLGCSICSTYIGMLRRHGYKIDREEHREVHLFKVASPDFDVFDFQAAEAQIRVDSFRRFVLRCHYYPQDDSR